uniref:HAT C-terminal dimerisation domain-containing protein n=1 Tax=Trichogramma kaykai TaxID=54128 RepID=A0ABD2WMA6_9HYME
MLFNSCMKRQMFINRYKNKKKLNPEDLSRKSATFCVKRFSGSHTFDAIAEMLESVHLEFNLTSDKIAGSVSDNGSNFVKAFREFGINEFYVPESDCIETSANDSDSGDDSEPVDDDIVLHPDENEEVVITDFSYYQLPKHFRCASHTLNLLATTDFLKVLKKNDYEDYKDKHTTALEKSQCLWKSLRSLKKKEEVRKELNCFLKRPVPTRWNSLFDSWKQLFDKWKLITSREVQNIVSMPNEFDYSDYDHIREYLLWNEPLAKCIDKLQGEDNMYYGYVLPTLLNLRLKWKNL